MANYKKNYTANYHHKNGSVDTAEFNAATLKEAKQLAQFHKRHVNALKGTAVTVRLKNNN